MGIDREELREETQQTATGESGTQTGGGPAQSDMGAPGGSGSGGGYRNAQNQQNQGQDRPATPSSRGQSRGEAYDEAQGGGRGPESVGGAEEFAEDQQEHQDRGQRWIEEQQEESGGG